MQAPATQPKVQQMKVSKTLVKVPKATQPPSFQDEYRKRVEAPQKKKGSPDPGTLAHLYTIIGKPPGVNPWVLRNQLLKRRRR